MLSNCGAGEEIIESPLDCKEIKLVKPKENQSRIFIGRTDAEALILWPPDAKNWFIWKDADARKDWRQEEKGMTEDETVGWYHRLNGLEFEWTPGVGDGQGGLVCCSPWGCKEADMTEWLNWIIWIPFHWKDWCWTEAPTGFLILRTDSLEKTLMLGKIESRRRAQQRMR